MGPQGSSVSKADGMDFSMYYVNKAVSKKELGAERSESVSKTAGMDFDVNCRNPFEGQKLAQRDQVGLKNMWDGFRHKDIRTSI